MERDKLYTQHIKDLIHKIIAYTKGLDYKKFIESPQTSESVILNIVIIGEAAKKLSNEYKQEHSDIVWKDVIGMRDKLIHDYAGTDLNVVWDTAITAIRDIPDLKKKLE